MTVKRRLADGKRVASAGTGAAAVTLDGWNRPEETVVYPAAMGGRGPKVSAGWRIRTPAASGISQPRSRQASLLAIDDEPRPGERDGRGTQRINRISQLNSATADTTAERLGHRGQISYHSVSAKSEAHQFDGAPHSLGK